jgi:Holliday junction resolvase-like predicted endonuclease
MRYWLHRISWLDHVSYPLLEAGYLSIGWSDFSDKEFLEKSSEVNGKYFDKKFNEKYGYLPRNRQKNKPINLKSILFDKSIDLWLSIIKKELNPDKFEKLILLYFQRVGASNVYIPSKNEANKVGDVDIVAEFEHTKSTICVQVKFHDNETIDWAVKQIRESAESKKYCADNYTTQYWVITSGDSFTEEAKKLASENDIILIDGREFVRMFISVGIQNITEI